MTRPVAGRSLWAEARGRLIRNRAALTSIDRAGPGRPRLRLRAVLHRPSVRPGLPRLRAGAGEPGGLSARPTRSSRTSSASRARVRAKAEGIDRRRRQRPHDARQLERPADRRAAARLFRALGPVRRRQRRREAAGRPAARRRRAAEAPALPLRHRHQRPRSSDPHHEGRARSRSPSACSRPSSRS